MWVGSAVHGLLRASGLQRQSGRGYAATQAAGRSGRLQRTSAATDMVTSVDPGLEVVAGAIPLAIRSSGRATI